MVSSNDTVTHTVTQWGGRGKDPFAALSIAITVHAAAVAPTLANALEPRTQRVWSTLSSRCLYSQHACTRRAIVHLT